MINLPNDGCRTSSEAAPGTLGWDKPMTERHAQPPTQPACDPNIRSGCCLGCAAFIFMTVIGVGAFYGGGWEVAWGATRASGEALVVDASRLLIRVNSGYYGIVQTDRFFDSPVLSWILLVVAVLSMLSAPGSLVVKTKHTRRSAR